MHCWREEARSESTGICLRCRSYKVIGRTVSYEAVLTCVCSASPTTSREACLSLFGSLRCIYIYIYIYMLGAKYGFAPSADCVAQSKDSHHPQILLHKAWILASCKFPRIAQSNLGWYLVHQLLNKICGIGSAERVDVRRSAHTQTGG